MVLLEGVEYLTVDEAAHLLGVKRATLYAYVSRGVLRSYRQGITRQRLSRRVEIERLLRVAPSAARSAGLQHPIPVSLQRQPPEIPLAESWIRD